MMPHGPRQSSFRPKVVVSLLEVQLHRALNFTAFVLIVAWLVVEPGWTPLVSATVTFAAFFRDDIHGIIGRHILSLAPRPALLRDLRKLRYSFTSGELINPGILDELLGWLGDSGYQVVSVNIDSANESNRYFGDVSVRRSSGHPVVTMTHEGEWVAYQYLGHSFSGVHVVQTWRCGGGSGVFCDILLLTVSYDKAIACSQRRQEKVERTVLKSVGSICLGDRYDGIVKYRCGLLTIGEGSQRCDTDYRRRRLWVL